MCLPFVVGLKLLLRQLVHVTWTEGASKYTPIVTPRIKKSIGYRLSGKTWLEKVRRRSQVVSFTPPHPTPPSVKFKIN